MGNSESKSVFTQVKITTKMFLIFLLLHLYGQEAASREGRGRLLEAQGCRVIENVHRFAKCGYIFRRIRKCGNLVTQNSSRSSLYAVSKAIKLAFCITTSNQCTSFLIHASAILNSFNVRIYLESAQDWHCKRPQTI